MLSSTKPDPSLSPTALVACGGTDDDLITGKYKALTSDFTPDLLAAGLNTTMFPEFGLTIHSSGVIGVFDQQALNWSTTLPMLVTRPTMTSRWIIQGPIAEVPPIVPVTQPFYDPALVNTHGQLHLLLHSMGDIAMAPLHPATNWIGLSTLIVLRSVPGSPANSPPRLSIRRAR